MVNAIITNDDENNQSIVNANNNNHFCQQKTNFQIELNQMIHYRTGTTAKKA